jgi:NADH-quinone oxidoreductase subunit M
MIIDQLIWIPVLIGIIVLLLGEKRSEFSYQFSLLTSSVLFFLSIYMYFLFDNSLSGFQFELKAPWIERFNINYHVGIDGISLPLIMLTTFLTPIVIYTTKTSPKNKIHQYIASFLILEGMMIGVFSALDAFLFYVFWEAMLIPMFLIIGVWGGRNRIYATVKFFLYTFLGSVFMLIAIIYLYMQTGSYSITDFYANSLSINQQILIFLAFLCAFAVKIPMWPVHTWLPDAHVEAPTGGSVVLAAILLKMGGYGFLRFSLPVTPDASMIMAPIMIALSLIAIIYIGLVALAQNDMKKLIAYSSISHMGFVTLGCFVFFIQANSLDFNTINLAISGAMIQMVSHGLISAALFLSIGVMYDRLHTRNIQDYGGIVTSMPKFSVLMVFFALSNAALPGTSGFVGELTVILASFKVNIYIAFLSALTLIIGAAYTLWMIKRVIFGSVINAKINGLQDMKLIEAIPLSILALFILLLGVWPKPLIDTMNATIIWTTKIITG